VITKSACYCSKTNTTKQCPWVLSGMYFKMVTFYKHKPVFYLSSIRSQASFTRGF